MRLFPRFLISGVVLGLLVMTGCGTTAAPAPTISAADSAAEGQAAANPTIDPSATSTPTPNGVIVFDPPVALVDYTLTNQQGEAQPFSDFKGSYVLMSFGYTHCPDICPLTLAHFKRIKNLIGDDSGTIKFVFVSVDGKRDTPERLNEYLLMIDDTFIGLTGEEALLRDVIGQYNGTFVLENAGGFRENYPVQHTAGSFLIDPDGRWARSYVYEAVPDAIAADIQALIQG